MSATTDYGYDTSCTNGLRTGRFVYGQQIVAEACYRRLTTPRGMLRGGEEEANYGLDLSELIGSTSTDSDVASLPGRIEGELSKDERIDAVNVTVVETVEGVVRAFTVTVEAETGDGPFTLVLLASAVTVELLGITAEVA